jgi:hypothetical protein
MVDCYVLYDAVLAVLAKKPNLDSLRSRHFLVRYTSYALQFIVAELLAKPINSQNMPKYAKY